MEELPMPDETVEDIFLPGGRLRLDLMDETAAAALREALSSGWPARLSSTKFLTKRPDWMSSSTFFISHLVSSVMMRGPVVMSPYSAVFEIE